VHISTIYIDDSCLQGYTYNSCQQNINDTVELLDKLGFTISLKKSVLIPTQKIVFLGFVLCSTTLTVRLTTKKCEIIAEMCNRFINTRRSTIKQLCQIIGKLVAATPGVTYAPLYIRPLEQIKDRELRKHRGNFNSFFSVTPTVKCHLQWWIDNIHSCYRNIVTKDPDFVLYTDSSRLMWGAYEETRNKQTNGFWSAEEQQQHINILELKAFQLALYSFYKDKNDIHIKIYMDNTTSVSYINRYGGKIIH